MSIQINNFNTLPTNIQLLFKKAKDVARNAYNLYSGFHVGVAVETKKGNIYTGTFMENASYGITICAEPAAVLAAISAGDLEIVRIVVLGGKQIEKPGNIVTPCGRCRQIIYEISHISGIDIEIYCSNGDCSKIILTTISELLPHPFGPQDLGMSEVILQYKKKILQN